MTGALATPALGRMPKIFGIPGVNRKSLELFVPCTILATACAWAAARTGCGV